MKFEAKCDTCNTLIDDPWEGFLWIDLGTIPHPDEEYTPSGSWRVTHIECIDYEALKGSMYQLELGQMVIPHRFLYWTAHVWRKPWLPRTDFESFLRQAGEGGPLESVRGRGRGVPPPKGWAGFGIKELP